MTNIKVVYIAMLILLFLTAYTLYGFTKSPRETIPLCPDCNIILISIDALRADHLGCYGYNKNTSPFIDSLAKKSLLFKKQISQAPFTSPSHMSMFTSLYPSQHLICQNHIPECNDNYGLSDKVITLPMVLKQNKYITVGYCGDNNHLGGKLGFSKGFDLYTTNTYNFSQDLAQIESWFEKYKNRKFFLFYHTYEVHDPYFPPKNYNKRFGNYVEGFDNLSRVKWIETFEKSDSVGQAFSEFRDFYFKSVMKNKTIFNHAVSQYDAEIAYMDDFINDFFSLLEKQGILNKTIVVFTADHGEEFYEHGGFLHSKLYKETLHVPLIIFLPNFQHYKIDYYTTSLDLAPTIFDIVGIKNKGFQKQKEGESLIKYILMNKSRETDVFSEYPYEYMSLIHGKWKFYTHPKENFIALFNLNSDPDEQHNLADSEDKTLKSLKQLMDKKYSLILKKQFPSSSLK